MATVADCVTFATARADVDPHRIGLLGVSLGASLALTQASQDGRIGAVAEFYGAMPDLAAGMIRRMPPVLIPHGAADPIVPAAEARKLERLLQGRGVPFEAHIYPGQGHGFTGEDRLDAAARVLDFFDRHLRN